MPLAPPDFIHCFHTVPWALIIVLGIGRKGPVLHGATQRLSQASLGLGAAKQTLATARI